MGISERIYSIPLKHIRISECNARLTDKKIGIEELAQSIKRHGLLQPVTLRGSYGNPPYELIVGQRRYHAHRLIPKSTIEAVFCGDINDWEAKILSLTENMHRVELNHADKAEAITALYLHYNRNDRRVSRELDIPLRTVRDYIKIEEQATAKAKRLLREGRIRKADVKRVIDAAQGDTNKADRLLDKMPYLSKYEKSRAVRYSQSHPKASFEEIIEVSQKQVIETTIILSLPKEIVIALNKAAYKLSMDRESVARKALSDWLENKGFLKGQI